MRPASASYLVLGALCGGVLLLPVTAFSQTAPTTLQSSPIPNIKPETPPNLGAGLPNFQPLTAEGKLPSAMIQVGTVTVIGGTAFPQAQLNQLVAGLAGQRVALSKIEDTRLALVALYRKQGFVLSTVSMDIDGKGDVRFIITEGHIVQVKLSDDIGPVGSLVLRFLNHLTNERPVSEASLEHWLLLAQQIPGVSVHAVLQADSDDPGALTLVAEVAKQTVSALATADNRGFQDTGPEEGLGVFDINSVTSLGDQTEVSLFHTAGNTDNFGQVSESFFVGSSGLRIKLYGGAGRAQPYGTLANAHYRSFLEVYGGQVSYPLLLRRNQALTVTFHADGTQNLIYTEGFRTSSESVRVARLASQYAWQDLWAGTQRSAVSVFDIQFSQGIPAFGAAPDGRALGVSGRYREKQDFWKLNASIARVQTLLTPAPDTTLSLRVEAGGQFSNNILPGGEEFNLGGARYTRGFYAGEVSGDKAVYATAELQLNTGASFNIFKLPVDFGAQFYAFYDYGESWVNLSTDLRHRLESAGVGVRLGLTQHLELDGEYVHRLTPQLDAGNPTSMPLPEHIFYWGITARY
ncbi:MAG TPA: ShlB/FhaC/HecB family hemolysin secretion/activation protein [Acidocella sp.]|nr:MAG: peptide ABC transporter permease [Acidocella sp. 21-58-7]HQT63991.1 ShlB/FhaC/HecB family hemolysin secretion/activation protein [Acidocella sp.]HQU03366.1 ShlB/FhaC/HecB family hemolysin secretion/activation protein [Acidocella sp.]